ncbi:MAG: DNA gyrase C-terminal beta-propeller domain-containing protein, partial [Pseudomonadota bacterium]
RTSKGLAIINLLSITEGERVTSLAATTGYPSDTFMVMATRKGEIKKTSLDKFTAVRSSGLIAFDLASADELVSVCLAKDDDDIIMVTRKGQSICFGVASLRAASRTSGGVRGLRLGKDDGVVSLDRVDPEAFLLVVTEKGLGKITPLAQYPRQHRGGSGVRTFKIVEKSGEVTAARVVSPKYQVFLISAEGMMELTPVKEKDPTKGGISTQGRSTQGVKLMTLDEGDRLVAITAVE